MRHKKEKTMTTARWFIFGVCGLAGILLLAGCENPDKQRALALQDQVNKLQAENDDLRSRLAAAMNERDQWRNRAQALEKENADLRAQLSQKPPVEGLAGWKYSGPYAWTELSTDFLFDSGKATLRPAAQAKLQQVVSEINANFPDKAIWVLGHTDTDPIKVTKNLWKDNLDLSANRGMTVFREMMKLGIDPKRMIAGGQGEYYPVASNATRAGKQQNRRVEIIAVPLRGSPSGSPAPEAAAPEKTTAPPK
jgi:flagellar motor protein MotB